MPESDCVTLSHGWEVGRGGGQVRESGGGQRESKQLRDESRSGATEAACWSARESGG